MIYKIVFANPKMFLFLILLIPAVWWYINKWQKYSASVLFSDVKRFKDFKTSIKVYLSHFNFGLQIIAYILIVIVLARPQSTNKWKNVTTEGIDIIIALDISGSMLAADFKPDRLEAAKEVAAEFINGRPDDRIGLVVFAAESFTQCPITTDHAVLLNLLKDIKMGMITDGTAIGMGLATAVNRLKDSKCPSKVIILLTDGVNNQGAIAPITAADIAKSFNIKVYTIGVGTTGMAPYPVQTPFGTQYQDMEVEIDEATLSQIAHITGGEYFRATNNQKLRDIYKKIDQMEKSNTQVKEYKKREEEYFKYGLIAFVVLLLSFGIKTFVLRSIP